MLEGKVYMYVKWEKCVENREREREKKVYGKHLSKK